MYTKCKIRHHLWGRKIFKWEEIYTNILWTFTSCRRARHSAHFACHCCEVTKDVLRYITAKSPISLTKGDLRKSMHLVLFFMHTWIYNGTKICASYLTFLLCYRAQNWNYKKLVKMLLKLQTNEMVLLSCSCECRDPIQSRFIIIPTPILQTNFKFFVGLLCFQCI